MTTVCKLGSILFSQKNKELPQKINRILFFKTGAIGDILMTTPLVRAVRHKFPGAVIDYACGRSFSDALRGNKNINYIIEFDERMFFRRGLREIKKLATKIKENRYDLIFILDKHWAAGVFGAFAGKFRIGFDRNGEGFANNLNVFYCQNKHDIEAYLDLAIYLRAKPVGTWMEIQIDEKSRKFAKKTVEKGSIAIAPGGGSNTGQRARIKIWPKENYLQLANALTKKSRIILIGGKDDMRTCGWIRSHAKNKGRITNLCGKTTVKQTAALLRLCSFVVCNDSGAMHLASCVNNNIISLFGPTNPHVLAPLNKGSQFIWKEKSACYDIQGNFDKCERNMMSKITVEDVLHATKKYAK